MPGPGCTRAVGEADTGSEARVPAPANIRHCIQSTGSDPVCPPVELGAPGPSASDSVGAVGAADLGIMGFMAVKEDSEPEGRQAHTSDTTTHPGHDLMARRGKGTPRALAAPNHAASAAPNPVAPCQLAPHDHDLEPEASTSLSAPNSTSAWSQWSASGPGGSALAGSVPMPPDEDTTLAADVQLLLLEQFDEIPTMDMDFDADINATALDFVAAAALLPGARGTWE